jgi:hypothetical protein
MATPNYGYEKRQKELAKRKKKEEKLKDKAARKLSPNGDELPADDADDGDDTNVAAVDHIPPTPPSLPTKDS